MLFNKLPEEVPFEGYAGKLREALQEAHESARSTLKVQLKRTKKDYDARKYEEKLTVGDPVYCLNHEVRKGKSEKLRPIWKGPGLIIKALSPHLFVVRFNNQEKKDMIINHDEMKKCNNGPESFPKWMKKQMQSIKNEEEISYCFCGVKDEQSFMVQCEKCFEWYHGRCVKITQSFAEKHPFVCHGCSK